MYNRRTITGILTLALALGVLSVAGAQRGGGMRGGAFGGDSPTRSNTMGLLMRPEVQTELRLDIGQRKALDQLFQQSRTEMRQRMRQNFQNMRNLSREERRAQMEQMRTQIQEQRAAYQGEISKKVEEILKPKQVQRLHELDLQRRGPLALADPKVAEEIGISNEKRAQVNKINSDLQAENRQVMQQFFEQMRLQDGVRRGANFDWQDAMAPLQRKRAELRKTAEEKVLALLTSEEKARWKAAQGEKFRGWRDQPGGQAFRPF